MTDTLLTRLERYGDDLDRAAGAVDASTPHRTPGGRGRRGVLAFAAACVLLVGFAAVLVLGSDDDPPLAEDPAPTSAVLTPEETFESTMEPLFAHAPTAGSSGSVALDDGTLSVRINPDNTAVFSWQGLGDEGVASILPPQVPAPPFWCCHPWPEREGGRTILGAVGPNGTFVEVVQFDGTTTRETTHVVAEVPGPRLFRVRVSGAVGIQEIRVLDETGAVVHVWDGQTSLLQLWEDQVNSDVG